MLCSFWRKVRRIRVSIGMKTLTIMRLAAAIGCAAFVPSVQAADATPTRGGSITLTVDLIEGSAPLTYRWYLNGNLVATTTKPILVRKNLRLADSGTYTVRISNEFGATASNPQTVLVHL